MNGRHIVLRGLIAILTLCCGTVALAQGPLTITTKSLPDGVIGRLYSVQIVATGGAGLNQWSVPVGVLPDGIPNPFDGKLQGTPTRAGTFSFTIRVSDQSGASATLSTSITIQPQLTFDTPTLPDGIAKVPYSLQLSASGGLKPYKWTVASGTLPDGLTLSIDGLISGTPTRGGTGTGIETSFIITLTDNGGFVLTRSLSIKVIATMVITTPPVLPDCNVGLPCTLQLVAENGTPPYFWERVSGGLPAGLTMSSSGAISGTPTQRTDVPVKLLARVTDAAGLTAIREFSLTVQGEAPPLVITTTSPLPNVTRGEKYSVDFQVANGTAPYIWTLTGTLPAGLAFVPAGNLAGTPTQSGKFSFTVSVKDSRNATISKAFDLTVFAGPTVSPLTCPDGTVGQVYVCQLTAQGGSGSYQWSVSPPGALKPDLDLNPVTGLITGKPTSAQSLVFTVTVTLPGGAFTSQDYKISITALTISTLSLPDGVVTERYNTVLVASGATGALTWSVSNGSLPRGLVLGASNGVISGTPDTVGNVLFTVTAKDGAGNIATRNYTIQVRYPSYNGKLIISGLPNSRPASQQSQISMTVDQAYPLDMTGTLTLSFDSTYAKDDPAVVFSGGSKTIDFKIAANANTATFSGQPNALLNGGSVAGKVWISAALNVPVRTFTFDQLAGVTVDEAVPQISSATATSSGGGLQVVIAASTTTREISGAVFTFTFNLPANTNYSDSPPSINLAPIARTWFDRTESVQSGGQFLYTQPFTVGNALYSNISKIVVTLTNSRGKSEDYPVALR